MSAAVRKEETIRERVVSSLCFFAYSPMDLVRTMKSTLPG